MPLASTRAFVLGTAPVKEQDRIIHLLTEDRGILRAIAPGSLKVRNRFGALFELFTEGEFHYYWQENREFITISKGEIITSYYQLVSDAGNVFYFYLIADIFLKFLPYSHQDNRLYRLIHAILTERREGIPMDLLLLYFLVWVLRIEGIMFTPLTCQNCGKKPISQGWIKNDFRGVLCHQCKTTESPSLHSAELHFLHWTQKHAPKELAQWEKQMDVAKMIRTFTRKIQHHGEISFKSAQYLPEFR